MNHQEVNKTVARPERMNRCGPTASLRASNNVVITNLIAAKVRALAPMIVIYMVAYIGVTVLGGFAKDFMALKVAGSLNIGFVLIALNYVISWVLALVYVRVANANFDPMVERAAGVARRDGGRR
jgi:uncharacterized membrane protein (DUF485 family)